MLRVDTVFTLNFRLTIANNAISAPGNDIVPATTDNYLLSIFLSDTDITVSGNTQTVNGNNLLTTTDLTQGLSASGGNFDANGNVDLTLPSISCLALDYICVTLSEGIGYTDSDTSALSNSKCMDITLFKICFPGI